VHINENVTFVGPSTLSYGLFLRNIDRRYTILDMLCIVQFPLAYQFFVSRFTHALRFTFLTTNSPP